MKQITSIAIAILFTFNVSIAQNDKGTIDDFGRISLTPVLPNDMENMPKGSQKLFLSKLKQIATKNGLGGVSANPQFVITGNVNVIDKELTETAPPMISYNLEANFYIVDYHNKTILRNVTVELKGVGKNETKAYASAIKLINPKSSKIRNFVKKGKNKIIEYYNTQCEIILKQAKNLEKMGDYEGAIYTLINIPTVCKECHYKALNNIEPIYKKMIGEDCKNDLDSAKIAFNNNDIEKAKQYLENIEPGTDCYNKAVDLAKKINEKSATKTDSTEYKVEMKENSNDNNENEKNKNLKEVVEKQAEKQSKTYDLDFIK